MPQWKPEDERLFAELCRRAEQQSREAALRAASAPPPVPPSAKAGGAAAPSPPATAPGGGARTPQRPAPSAPGAARRPAVDQETLLILVVLAFLIRQHADREKVTALLSDREGLAQLLQSEQVRQLLQQLLSGQNPS